MGWFFELLKSRTIFAEESKFLNWKMSKKVLILWLLTGPLYL